MALRNLPSSGDESCPPCELGEGNSLHVSDGEVTPYALKEGVASRGLGGVPPSYPLATRKSHPSGKLRIKLKSRSLGESSHSRPQTNMLSVLDIASVPELFPRGEDVVPLASSNDKSPLSREPPSASLRATFGRMSPDPHCPELKLSPLPPLSDEGGDSARSHGPGDVDVGSYVDSEEAELRTPPLQDHTGVQSLDEMSVALGFSFDTLCQVPIFKT
ncbi:hypothetical protein Dimus_024458 [Dionaea muscipula]